MRILVGAGLLVACAASLGAQKTATRQAPRFEVDPMWPMPMPNRWILGSATGVTVDSRDHVFVVNLNDSFNARTESGSGTNPPTGECCTPAPSVLEFDTSGKLLGNFGGAGSGYDWPGQVAGVAVDDAGNVWIGGAGGSDTRIVKFSRDGKFVAQYGKVVAAPARQAGAAAPDTAYQGVSPARGGRGGRGGRPAVPVLPAASNNMESFGGAMGFAFDSKANEVFVADGARNHRVAVLDANTGAIKRIWGAYGNTPNDAEAAAAYSPNGEASKQFSTVRCVKIANDGLVYVCDAQNDRIQVFKKDGSFVKEMKVAPKTLGAGSVWDVAFSRDAGQKYVYVADGQNMKVHILDRASLMELAAFGDGGRQPGQFYAVHSIATDSKGNIYTVETYEGKRVQKFNYKGLATITTANEGVVWPAKKGAKK